MSDGRLLAVTLPVGAREGVEVEVEVPPSAQQQKDKQGSVRAAAYLKSQPPPRLKSAKNAAQDSSGGTVQLDKQEDAAMAVSPDAPESDMPLEDPAAELEASATGSDPAAELAVSPEEPAADLGASATDGAPAVSLEEDRLPGESDLDRMMRSMKDHDPEADGNEDLDRVMRSFDERDRRLAAEKETPPSLSQQGQMAKDGMAIREQQAGAAHTKAAEAAARGAAAAAAPPPAERVAPPAEATEQQPRTVEFAVPPGTLRTSHRTSLPTNIHTRHHHRCQRHAVHFLSTCVRALLQQA